MEAKSGKQVWPFVSYGTASELTSWWPVIWLLQNPQPSWICSCTPPSAADILKFQCQELEEKGCLCQSKSTWSFLVVIQGFTASRSLLIYYFWPSKQTGGHRRCFVLFPQRHVNSFLTSALVSWKAAGVHKIQCSWTQVSSFTFSG